MEVLATATGGLACLLWFPAILGHIKLIPNKLVLATCRLVQQFQQGVGRTLSEAVVVDMSVDLDEPDSGIEVRLKGV